MSKKRKRIWILVIALVILSLIATTIVPDLLEAKGKLGVDTIKQVEKQVMIYEN